MFRTYAVGVLAGPAAPENLLFPPTCGGKAATGGWKKKGVLWRAKPSKPPNPVTPNVISPMKSEKEPSMIALAVSDFDLPRALLAAGQIDVDYLETGGHFVERTVAQFPGRPLLLHNSVFNWSLAHPRALEEQRIVARTLEALECTRAPWLSVHLGFSAAEVF